MSRVATTASRVIQGLVRAQARGMATEKQILARIVGTKNISKITKSMKMVSAAKLRGDQARLEKARPFNAWTEAVSATAEPLEDFAKYDTFPQKNTIVALTSEKGLCGGVNSAVTRYVRRMSIALTEMGKEVKVVCVGEKGRAQLNRLAPEYIEAVCSDVNTPYNFETVCAIVNEITAHGGEGHYEGEADAVHIVFNQFKSAISYAPSIKTVLPVGSVEGEAEFDLGSALSEYDLEPDEKNELLRDLQEWVLASQVYHSAMESATSEQSSRMSAMENASKNAGEMIDKLTLQYNRARQARITTELIEIISGAAALDK